MNFTRTLVKTLKVPSQTIIKRNKLSSKITNNTSRKYNYDDLYTSVILTSGAIGSIFGLSVGLTGDDPNILVSCACGCCGFTVGMGLGILSPLLVPFVIISTPFVFYKKIIHSK
jgi:hypothetical protein